MHILQGFIRMMEKKGSYYEGFRAKFRVGKPHTWPLWVMDALSHSSMREV